jgi:hypothetical protein
MKSREAPSTGASQQYFTTTSGRYIVTDPPVRNLEEHRRRQVRRLAAVALVLAAYGVDVGVVPLPPGPEVCPADCGWCYPAAVVA